MWPEGLREDGSIDAYFTCRVNLSPSERMIGALDLGEGGTGGLWFLSFTMVMSSGVGAVLSGDLVVEKRHENATDYEAYA